MRACHFCIMNKANLNMELNDAMDAWAMNKTPYNMVRACNAGKAWRNWVLG